MNVSQFIRFGSVKTGVTASLAKETLGWFIRSIHLDFDINMNKEFSLNINLLDELEEWTDWFDIFCVNRRMVLTSYPLEMNSLEISFSEKSSGSLFIITLSNLFWEWECESRSCIWYDIVVDNLEDGYVYAHEFDRRTTVRFFFKCRFK